MTTVPRFRFPLGYDPCNPNVPKEEQQKLLFVRPWSRFKMPCITSGNITKEQFQMRTKAEVLQYKRKYLQLSYSQKLSLAVNNNFRKRSYVPKAHIDENGNLVPAENTTINNGTIIFDNNCNQIPVNKSTSSDVPGPAIDLFLDPNVPLIYFENPPRIYRAGGSINVDNINITESITTQIVSTKTVELNVSGDLNADILAQLAIKLNDPNFKNPTKIIIGTEVTSINGNLLGGLNLTIDGNPKRLETFGFKAPNLPHKCQSIGNYAFFICDALTSLQFPDSVKSIGTHAIYNCNNLPSIVLPNSVTSIGIFMAYFSPVLTKLILSNSLTIISRGAFDGCPLLASVTIPASVIQIDDMAFRGCNNLSTIIFNGSRINRNITLGTDAFDTSKTYTPPLPVGGTTITIPANGQTYIAI